MVPRIAAPARLAAPMLLSVLAVVGCGREGSTPPAGQDPALAQQEATATIGDVRVRASVLPTSRLNAAVAAQYGVAPSGDTVLLLVGIRQGPEADETALPATLDAHALDLRGVRQEVAMREVRSGALLDYVGIAEVTPPDSLRFDIDVTLVDGRRTRLRFSRDVFPE